MGYMTLADFRADIDAALGNYSIAPTKLDRWINQAYMELAGGVNFEILVEEDTSQSTTPSIITVNVPIGAISVDLVRNTTDDKLLGWVALSEFWRLSQTPGVPVKWCRRKNTILLNPVPNSVKALRILYRKYPTRFSAVGDLSVLPDTWDTAIYLLAAHYGLLARNEEQRAMIWLSRAATYIASRMTDEQLEYTTRGVGLNLPIVAQKAYSEKEG